LIFIDFPNFIFDSFVPERMKIKRFIGSKMELSTLYEFYCVEGEVMPWRQDGVTADFSKTNNPSNPTNLPTFAPTNHL